MGPPSATSLGVAAAVAVGAVAYYASRRKRQHALSRCGAARGLARVFTLSALDRTDVPGGKAPGPPGRPASAYLEVDDATAADVVPIAELFAAGTDYVLYSVEGLADEEPFMVFATLPATRRASMWRDEAFIDRGIRKQLELGASIAVASLADVEKALAEERERLATGAWTVAFVWNTGRCGSTLLHKATTNLGAVSLSEPHWLDQLMYGKGVAAPVLRRALTACVAAEAAVARRQTEMGWTDATSFILNPKAAMQWGGAHVLVTESAAAYPTSIHIYMYRSCEKVAQSFAGVKFVGGIPLPLRFAWFFGKGPMPLPPRPEALRELSSSPVAWLVARWISNVAGWAELVAARRSEYGPDDPIGGALHVRFDELTSKDLAARKTVLRAILSHIQLLPQDDDSLAPALAAWNQNSQAGSAMSGPKAKVVQDADLAVIRRCVREGLASVDVAVEDDGKNVLLPRTVGAAL
mmetsp:Transcript_24622/g.75933  ORF Transcript_24622/g.75933 Transcript_24622/m.75933 type:complete len:467 (+) Transcript_24622:412-1812(+)